MNPQGGHTNINGSSITYTSVNFADGYNDHATNYNSARTKTVYSVDSYDGNFNCIMFNIDSPVTLADGTIIEVGDLEEGDVLRGFSLDGLGTMNLHS